MNYLARMAGMLLMVVTECAWMSSAVLAQQNPAGYISPADSVQKRGTAPGMKVQLLSGGQGTKEYVVIFSQGDEAYSGLLDFAEEYHITSGHFTAIGAIRSAVLAWFDPQKKMYRENPINEQIEVASMVGDFALTRGGPLFTRTWLWATAMGRPKDDMSSRLSSVQRWRCSSLLIRLHCTRNMIRPQTSPSSIWAANEERPTAQWHRLKKHLTKLMRDGVNWPTSK